MAIITTAEYKTYAGITATTYDAQLNVLIPGLQAELETRCGRVFDTATFTEQVDGANSPTISVQNAPITSVTSIVLIDRAEAVLYTYPATGYKIDAKAGLVSRQVGGFWGSYDWRAPLNGPTAFEHGPEFPDGWRNVQIVYVGGYASNAMPLDLKRLMYDLTTTALALIPVDVTLKSERLGHYSYERGSVGLWDAFASRVRPWVRVPT